MKIYIPQRFFNLTLVLQYDSQQKRTFSIKERFSINQERARLLRDEIYTQEDYLNEIINTVLLDIQKTNWQPKTKL